MIKYWFCQISEQTIHAGQTNCDDTSISLFIYSNDLDRIPQVSNIKYADVAAIKSREYRYVAYKRS